MNHSMLDGRSGQSLTNLGTARAVGSAPVRDWMTRPTIAVVPASDFATMVTAITASRRGVLPVLSPEGAPIGVVSVSDLLAAYAGEETGRGHRAEITAGDLMTSPAVTVKQDRTVGEAVRLARRARVHHLPVVDGDGRLIGMLAPHDLLDSLRTDDEAMRIETLALALTPGSGVVPGSLRVRCERGHVVLAGRTRSRADAAALCLRVAAIDGLAGLTDHLGWDVDDVAADTT
ncbi:CBS domain-containing protein [Kitasatospora sp. NPDC048540]|uniref:CBS domain-containing protein n=1 Tax=unclassified Kitasatospora TaxID=2633591 RepID=UPI00068B64CF|nr:CBS domain-containing protein [Kitasatospora sp. MBT63]